MMKEPKNKAVVRVNKEYYFSEKMVSNILDHICFVEEFVTVEGGMAEELEGVADRVETAEVKDRFLKGLKMLRYLLDNHHTCANIDIGPDFFHYDANYSDHY